MSKKFLLSAVFCFALFGIAASSDSSTEVPEALTSEVHSATEVPHDVLSEVHSATEVPHDVLSEVHSATPAPDASGIGTTKVHEKFGKFPRARQSKSAEGPCNRFCLKYVFDHHKTLSKDHHKTLSKAEKRHITSITKECKKECLAFNRNHGNTNATIFRQSEHHKK